MAFFRRLVDLLALRSEHPLQRLLAYYIFVGIVIVTLAHFFPVIDRMFLGERTDPLQIAPQLLDDGLASVQTVQAAAAQRVVSRLETALSVLIALMGTLLFMLPVSWVYMSAHKNRSHNQALAQTLITLPLVVAGIVLVVQNSLALAFSLAGVVAAVRFRTALSDARDTVFIFLAIAVGFASGVQSLSIAGILSIVFNFVVVMIWRSDYGRNVLEPTASAQWAEPLTALSEKTEEGEKVPDRDLVLALTPKKVEVLAERFNRIRNVMGSNGKKPKYNGMITITTYVLSEAQQHVEDVLEEYTKRWKLDEVVTNAGKPSILYYLVRLRKSVPRDALLTAIRTNANGSIQGADIEVGDAIAIERLEDKKRRKLEAKGG
jgi:hypothetical protein